MNLDCLESIVDWNADRGILFHRITSDLVPFASHPVNRCDWPKKFRERFEEIGNKIKGYGMRISMHPDQFVVVNSDREKVVKSALRELEYHGRLLDLMKLPDSAIVQIHVGGVYGNKKKAKKRFIREWNNLPKVVSRRLAIENDDRSYSSQDCIDIHEETGIPVVFDNLHQKANPGDWDFQRAFETSLATWDQQHAPPIVHYSSQAKGQRTGKHAETLDKRDFSHFIEKTKHRDFDLMLEIKDKETSAFKAMKIIANFRDEKKSAT